MMRMVLAGALAVLLSACAGFNDDSQDSPHYRYGSGWVLQLNRALEIGAGEASVRLQSGRIVPRNSVQEQRPFCVFEIATVKDVPQAVAPGRFEIWQVQRRVSTIADAGAPAAPPENVAWVAGGDTPSFLYYKTEFRLRAPDRPELIGLTCMQDQLGATHYGIMRHLTLDEIRATLGDWFSIIPPQGGR